MANEFKVKNGLIVIGELTTSGTITINGALAATQSWVTSQAYLTSSSLTSYATQSYVTSAIASLVDSAPGALDTLRELATALGNDASFSTTVTNSIASKQNASTAINTSNIASQSVSYATSAGSAGSAGYVTNQSGQLASYDNRTISPSETNASYLQFGFTSFNNNNTAPWADYLHLRSYEDSSAGADNLVVFNKSTIGMRIYQQTFGSASAYSSYADVWHSGNLTNLNQLTNGPGYLTSYTEVDTLATVTGRGATTNTSITVGHDLTVQADGGVGHTASRLWLNSHNNYRGAGVHMSGVGSTWFAGTPYTDFDGGYVIARTGTSNDQASAQYSNALLTVKSSGNVGIGTDTPASKLSITGTVTVTQGDYNQDSFLNASAIFYYAIKKARGTSSVPLALNTNDKIGGISASGYTGSGYITASAIEFRNSGAVSASSMPTSILFTAGSTNFSGRTPSLKISETENILINSTASDTAKLSIKGSGSTSATTSLLVQNSASDTSMAVLDNGNVGIGTASPGTNKLHVFNGSSGGVAYNSGGLVDERSGRASIQL